MQIRNALNEPEKRLETSKNYRELRNMSSFAERFPIPHINSQELRKMVFTHRSATGQPATLDHYEEELDQDNERLALLGNEAIALAVTDVLYHALTTSRPGDLDTKRQALANKDNLATWCDNYGLWRFLKTQPSQTILLRHNKNTRAQVLQAYVGAVYMESGLDVIKAWLEPVILESLREAAERNSEDNVDGNNDAPADHD